MGWYGGLICISLVISDHEHHFTCLLAISMSLEKYVFISSVHSGFLCGSAGKETICNARDLGSISGLGRSPREGKGYPFQYSGLENVMDYTIHGVTKSWTQLNNFHFHKMFFHLCPFPFLSPMSKFLVHTFFTSWMKFTSRCFILFDAFVDEVFFLISLSDSLLLVYRSARDFYT